MEHNLPVALTKRVGREVEIATVRKLLASTRLLTLTGIGGIGKTTLALEVCRALVEDEPAEYADGAWLVELGPLVNETLVGETVASALGLRHAGTEPPLDTVVRALRTKRLVIILDNCEHLIEASALLAERLLSQCAGVCILATSREALNVPGELSWQVPALPAEDAVTLFVTRAGEVRAGFAATAAQTDRIAELCDHLDRSPLAIELAAAGTRSLTVEEIARRLDQRFQLLIGGRRTAPGRQQSLRAMVDWSYERLSAAEQRLFARLSVFAGGWTLEAAEAVCGDDSTEGLAQESVLGLLLELVRKSMVACEQRTTETRYRMLETLHQYAAARLREFAEEAELRTRHLDWFAECAELAEPELQSENQAACADRLDAELPNIRAALAWAASDGSFETGLVLAASLRIWWWRRAHGLEAIEWLEKLLAMSAALSEASSSLAATRARAAAALTYVRLRQGDRVGTRQAAELALSLARQVGDRATEAWALLFLGQVCLLQEDDCAGADERFSQGLAIAQDLRDPRVIYPILIQKGWAAETMGRPDEALTLYEQATKLINEFPDPAFELLALYSGARAAVDLGDLELARKKVAAALGLPQGLTDLAPVLAKAAGLAAAEGKAERALRLAGAATGLLATVSARLPRIDELWLDRHLAVARNALSSGAASDAWEAGRSMGLESARGYALADFAFESGEGEAIRSGRFRVVIDDSERDREVTEITETRYFQQLRQRAAGLRAQLA